VKAFQFAIKWFLIHFSFPAMNFPGGISKRFGNIYPFTRPIKTFSSNVSESNSVKTIHSVWRFLLLIKNDIFSFFASRPSGKLCARFSTRISMHIPFTAICNKLSNAPRMTTIFFNSLILNCRSVHDIFKCPSHFL